MNKFDGILSQENMDIIVAIMNVVDVPKKHKIHLIESVCNVVYIYQDYFNKLKKKEKIEAINVVALVFNTLLDSEINPLASKYTLKAIYAFNNNVFVPENIPECEMWDGYNKACMFERTEKIFRFPWEEKFQINQDCFEEMP